MSASSKTRGRTPLKVALVGVSSPGYRSLALAYVRAYAQADRRLSDAAFVTLDLDTGEDPWWIAYRILELGPDVVGFSVVCWNARIVYEAARIAKAARPELVVVVGGPEVGPIAEDVLKERSAIDAVVRGEGELTFADLLDTLGRGGDVASVAGVSARRGDDIVSAADRPLVADLDTIPSPYLSGVLEPTDGATYLETYRGCPHRCAYCFEGKGYGRIRHFSRARVQEEVEYLARTKGIASFSFIDPVFNLTPDRLLWLAEMLEPHASAGLGLHTIEVDIERIDAEQASLLARAGVRSVETGPQSVGAAALELCHRDLDRERFAAGVTALRRVGIKVECDLIIGLPGDAFDEVVAGLDFAVRVDPGRVQVSTLRVLPGTELWSEGDRLGLVFDAEPPHEIIATAQMSYGELRRAETFAVAVARIYGATL